MGRTGILGPVSSEERPGINWTQVIAGALAAVTSAVVLSTLGVAGTLIGAAVGSIAASITSNVYQRGLSASRDQLAAQAAAYSRVSQARSELDAAVLSMNQGETNAQVRVEEAGRELSEAEHALAEADEAQRTGANEAVAAGAPALKEPRRWPWKQIAVYAGAAFLVAIMAVTAVELLTGRAVSDITGGTDGDRTTIPGLGGGEKEPTPTPTPTPSETPSVTPTETPSETPAESPSETPSETAEPSPSESPTEDLEGTPPVEPTPAISESPVEIP